MGDFFVCNLAHHLVRGNVNDVQVVPSRVGLNEHHPAVARGQEQMRAETSSKERFPGRFGNSHQQIRCGSRFSKLEVAWRFKTDNLGPFPEYKLEGTPIMVNGVIYTTGGTRRTVIALDAKPGDLIWSHSLREGKPAAASPRQLSGRGVSYWSD